MPSALLVDWDAIKQSAIAGVPIPDLARQWGMLDDQGKPDTTAIRKRSSREQWPIPRAVMDRAHKLVAEAKQAQIEARVSQGLPVSQSGLSQMSHPSKSTLSTVAESAVTYGQRAQIAILAGLVPQIEGAMQTPEQFRPKNVKELVMAGGLAFKLAGMDKDRSEVKVNVAMFTDGAVSSQVVREDGAEWADATMDVNSSA